MFLHNKYLLNLAKVGIVLLAFICTAENATAGTGYWDLFTVNLTSEGPYWSLVNGGFGYGSDPIVDPDPNGVPVFDTSSLGGISYGFGGASFGDGTLETTATIANSIQLSGVDDYHLSIVLDSSTLPHADNNFPSWGTVYDISVQPSDGGGGWLAPINVNWVKSPYDSNAMAQVMPNATTVKLAPGDFGKLENGNQNREIYGVTATLPSAAGYKVTFSTDLKTWDSYNTPGGVQPPAGTQNYSQSGACQNPINALPAVIEVPGKEFSNYAQDKNAAWANDALQNLAFNGLGAVADTYDYTGSGVSEYQIDALANVHDAYYWAAAQDQVPIVVSFAHPNQSIGGNIYYQMGKIKNTGVWCPASQVKANSNLDALELYGPENMSGPPGDDSNMFSLISDPGGVAVWQYNATLHQSVPYITTAQLKAALANFGVTDGTQIDLDALMVYDNEEGLGSQGFTWGPGDSIMFSVLSNLANGGAFDGGEIWIWIYGQSAQFFVHGGEVWDTAHDVGAEFGTGVEEIDALEAVAVPEPATILLLAVGALCMVGYLWQRL